MSDALAVMAGLRLESGEPWGSVAHPFQWDDAAAVLNGPELLHFQTRPRGASKTTDAAGVGLVVLTEQLPAGAQSYVAAADRDQAALLIRELAGFVQRTPGALFSQPPLVETWRVTVPSGASLVALPADGPSAFGLRPHLVIADELSIWPGTVGPKQVWEALFSALTKVAGARLLVLTMAGSPDHWSYGIRGQAASSPLWRLSETSGPTPWADPAVLEEQRRVLLPSQYARLHLARWVSPEDRLAAADDVDACVMHEGVLGPWPGVRYAIGLDIGLVNDATVATVAHREIRDGVSVVVVDRQVRWAGSRLRPVNLAAVEAFVLQASRSYNGAQVVADPFQAVHLCQSLRELGVQVDEYAFSQNSVGRLALTLFQLARDHQLDLPDDEGLIGELKSVRLIERGPGVFRVDHAHGEHDDRVISLGLAAQALLTSAPGFEPTVAPYRRVGDPARGSGGDVLGEMMRERMSEVSPRFRASQAAREEAGLRGRLRPR